MPWLVPLAWTLVLFGFSPPAPAQQPDQRAETLFKSIHWKKGPCKGALGDVATVDVPAGYVFVEQQDMKKFTDLTKNLASPRYKGALLSGSPESFQWFIVFSFEDIGKVPDDEKDKLDADAILKSLQTDEVQANKERQRLGYPESHIIGWALPPAYDSGTHNLVWAIRLQTGGYTGINYETRLLGRRGVMSTIVVCGPEDFQAIVPTAKDILTKKFSFKIGQKYKDWRPGDKVAKYGLTALIAGGAVAVAAKTGLLAKLIKPIIIGLVAVISAIGAFFKKIFGRGARASQS